MTAVHHELPIKVVIYNNSAFGLITLEAEGVGLRPFKEAISFPNPDFAALARACGGSGFTVKQPELLETTIREALATSGPVIIDATVVAYEIPNMPHMDVAKVGNVAVAKIKQALHTVIGS